MRNTSERDPRQPQPPSRPNNPPRPVDKPMPERGHGREEKGVPRVPTPPKR